MKAPVKSIKQQTPKRSASQGTENDAARKAIGFLMFYMTAIFLRAGQSSGEDKASARFAATFLTLFIATFILNKGQLSLATIYLILVQIAPELGQPVLIGTLFMIYVFLL